jgi:hypothetical protein
VEALGGGKEKNNSGELKTVNNNCDQDGYEENNPCESTFRIIVTEDRVQFLSSTP